MRARRGARAREWRRLDGLDVRCEWHVPPDQPRLDRPGPAGGWSGTVDVERPDGATALIAACQTNATASVKLLLQAGASVDHKMKNGRTAAMEACTRGFVESLQLLIDARADIHLQDSNGQTCLQLASGKEECMRLLDGTP